MVNYTKIFLIVAGVVMLLSSCTKRIDLDLEVMDPKPVIIGIINDSEQAVRLSTTSGYLSVEDGDLISGAAVTISDGVTSYAFTESAAERGTYHPVAPILVVEGTTYSLSVTADFYKSGQIQTYTATSLVAHTPTLDTLRTDQIRFGDNSFWLISVAYQDTDSRNYYLWKVQVNGSSYSGLNSYGIIENFYFRGQYVSSQMAGMVINRPNSDDEPVQVSDTISIAYSGVTEDYYNFIRGAKAESGGSNPLFSGPPADVKGNISNGALGVFTVHSVSNRRTVIQ